MSGTRCLQRGFIDKPESGRLVHLRPEGVTEWPLFLLKRPRRTARTTPAFLAPDAPPKRPAILCGEA